MKKNIEKIIVGLIIAAACTASAAIVKVSVLENEVETHKSLLFEIRQDVKQLLRERHE